MRPTFVRATYKLSEDEALQVEVQLANDYPDAMATARSEAVRGVKDLLINAMAVDKAMGVEGGEDED